MRILQLTYLHLVHQKCKMFKWIYAAYVPLLQIVGFPENSASDHTTCLEDSPRSRFPCILQVDWIYCPGKLKRRKAGHYYY